MPGDLNRVFLIGVIRTAPAETAKAVRFHMATTDRWTTQSGPRVKEIVHSIVVVQPSLATYAAKLRIGDRVLVEGALEHPNVVLGALHASLQLVRPASEEQGHDDAA